MYIPHGYVKIAKKIKGSKIYKKPPFYRTIWLHIILSARFVDQKRTIGKTKKMIKAGQLYTSYDQLSEDLHWYDNKKKCFFTRRQVKKAIEFFRQEEMITTEKLPRGVIISVCNYEEYQNHENYAPNLGHLNNNNYQTKTDTYENKNSNLGHQVANLGHQKFLQGLE